MTMIDTSAWVAFLRRGGDARVKMRVEECILQGEAAYTCPVYFELLTGARQEEIPHVEEGLSLCERVDFQPGYWDKAAGLFRKLRAEGITVPRDDVLIATVAIETASLLLCADRHFDLIRSVIPKSLRVEQFA